MFYSQDGKKMGDSLRRKMSNVVSSFPRGAFRNRVCPPCKSRSGRPGALCRLSSGNSWGASVCRDRPWRRTRRCRHRRHCPRTAEGKRNKIKIEKELTQVYDATDDHKYSPSQILPVPEFWNILSHSCSRKRLVCRRKGFLRNDFTLITKLQ